MSTNDPRGNPEIVEAAVGAALRSPCLKSRRGVAIWDGHGLISTGWNHQPHPFKCDGSDACKSSCNKLCIHAEAHALLRAGPRARDAQMLHVKVGEGELAVDGGPPSCWQCSRLILGADISVMWLLENGRGWTAYSAVDFHRTTLENVTL